jgi:1-acyl-sn-glycerol-3-phosphate acyltransferase
MEGQTLQQSSAVRTAPRPGPRLPLLIRFFRRFVILAGALLFRIQITGAENIPRGGCIVVANHLNWLDPFLLFIALPPEPRLYFIGATQAKNRSWKAWLLDRYDGWVPVERGAAWVGRDIFRRPLEVLENGAVLGLFPEGENGPVEGGLQPLKRGVGHFLLQADYPILPVALSGAKELYWRKPIRVIIGKPFHVQTAGLSRLQALNCTAQRIGEELRAIIPPYVEPAGVKKRLTFLNNLLDR